MILKGQKIKLPIGISQEISKEIPVIGKTSQSVRTENRFRSSSRLLNGC